jgi:ketosteroid isomerase-like protein
MHLAALDALHRAFERRDAEGIQRLVHPDATLDLITATDRGVVRGREAISGYMEDISGRTIMATFRSVEPVGDGALLAVGRLQRQGADNSLTDTVAVWLLRFRDGLLWQAESFTDEAAARRRAAVSLPEGEGS